MRKILPLIVTSMLAVSCFNDVGYEASYTLISTFSGMDEFFKADSAVAVPAFSYGPVAYFNTIAASETVSAPDPSKGGWIVSRSFYPVEILMKHISDGDSPDEDGDGGGSGDGTVTGLSVDWQSRLTPYCVSDTTDAGSVQNGTFLVFHQNSSSMPEHDVEFLQASVGTCTLSSMALNTTADVARYFKTEAVSGGGDYFKVRITGTSSNGGTVSADFTLADYSSAAKDSLCTEWKTVDISKLGSVRYIDFEIDALMSNNTAGRDLNYFCMDNLVASIHVKQ